MMMPKLLFMSVFQCLVWLSAISMVPRLVFFSLNLQLWPICTANIATQENLNAIKIIVLVMYRILVQFASSMTHLVVCCLLLIPYAVLS